MTDHAETRIDIRDWRDGRIIYSHQGVDGATLKDAVEAAVRDGRSLAGADMRGANMRDAYMIGANMSGANMRDANMRGANMRGTDMEGANMRDANMSGAYMMGANMSGADVHGVVSVIDLGRPGRCHAFAWNRGKTVMVQVGRKGFTLTEARAYWGGKDDRRDVMAALDYAEKIAVIRGWCND